MPIGFNLGGGRGGQRGGGKMRFIIAGVLVMVALVGYFSKEKVTNPHTGESYRRAMNVDQQKALGLQAVKEMIPQMGGAEDPKTSDAAALVDEVGRKLLATSDAGKSDFANNFNFFLIADTKTINAFALPGGQVSITRGLFDRLEDESQLAGVLGHEIGHVIAEHSAQQMAKGQLGQALAMAVGVASDSNQGAIAAQMANQMLQLKYGRDDETQSDEVGLKFMVQAGYDPAGMMGVMKILGEASKGSKQPEFLSSHPYPEDRVRTIEAYIEKNKDELASKNLTKGRKLPGAK